MIELKGRYTPAQARAIKKFLANKAEIKIRMSKPYKDIVKQKASEAGMSVNAYVMEAIEEKIDNVKDEIPGDIFENLMDWLKREGHTDEEITDCLKCLANK